MEAHGMYGERAALYDLIYSYKPYEEEAARVADLLAAEGVADGSTVLEAACGTGRYLEHLAARYRVLGLDVHRAMLDIARARLGDDVPLIEADMRDLDLDAPCDAIVCLFSSIGYLAPDGRDAAFAAFHRNLRPGGVVIVEPWIAPDRIRDRTPHVQIHRSEEICVARLCTTNQQGRVSHMDFHWLVATRDGVEHFTDVHRMWCSTPEEMLASLDAAGFDARREEQGLAPERGLLIGRRRA